MGFNSIMTEQSNKLIDAACEHGYSSAEYKEAKTEYFRLLEQEARKGGEAAWSWLGWEDPTDTLLEWIAEGSEADMISEILDDYLRFWEIIERVYPDRDYNYLSLAGIATSYIHNGDRQAACDMIDKYLQ